MRNVKVYVKVALTLRVDDDASDEDIMDIVNECDYSFDDTDGYINDAEIVDTIVGMWQYTFTHKRIDQKREDGRTYVVAV